MSAYVDNLWCEVVSQNQMCVCVCPSGECLAKVNRCSFMMPTDKVLCQDKLWFVFNTHYFSLPCCFTIFEVPLFLLFHSSSLACSVVKQMDPCSTFWWDQCLLPYFSLHFFSLPRVSSDWTCDKSQRNIENPYSSQTQGWGIVNL